MRQDSFALGTRRWPGVVLLAIASGSPATAERVRLVLVPSAELQSGGPAHSFRIGRFEVSNAEYAEFLNVALQKPGQPEGAFLYHDQTSGNVHVHLSEVSESGFGAPTDPEAVPVYLASAGQIAFDPVAQRYKVAAGMAEHPVTGVSWFGAVKFCNWLTLTRGMSPSARAYREGPGASEWTPAGVDTPSQIALSGFRLPMDGGHGGAHPHNEWHKAASRRAVSAGEPPAFDATYGFGRDTLENNDANSVANGDTGLNGTTRRGFFNGVNAMTGGGLTRDTENGYGLHDLCGNVAEWVHEPLSVDGLLTGAVRGGHFNLDRSLPQFRNDARASLPASWAVPFVGFRVAQSLAPVAPLFSVDEADLQVDGIHGGFFDQDSVEFLVTNLGDYSLDDLILRVDASWLRLASEVAPVVPPGASGRVELVLSGAESLPVGRHEASVELSDPISNTSSEWIVALTVAEPLAVDGPAAWEWSTPFCAAANDASASFRTVNRSVSPITWLLSADQTWLTARGPGGAASGTIPGRNDPAMFSADFNVQLNHLAGGLTPGEHLARVTLRDVNTGGLFVKEIRLTVGDPVAVSASEPSPAFEGLWQGPFAGPSAVTVSVSRCDTCGVDCDLELAVESDVSWLTIEPEDALEGPIDPGDAITFDIRLDQAAAALVPPGVHRGEVRFAAALEGLAPLPNPPVLPVTLTVREPIEGVVPREPWRVECEPSPGLPPTFPVTLRNNHGSAELSVRLTADAAYVAVEPEVVALLPGVSAGVSLRLLDESLPLLEPLTFRLTMTSLSTGVQLHHDVTIQRGGGLCVQPLTDFEASGRTGGRVEPALFVLRLANLSDATVPWSVSTGAEWLTVATTHPEPGAVAPGQRGHVVLAIDESLLPPPQDGSLRVETNVVIDAGGEEVTRRVTVTLAEPALVPRLAAVPGSAAQPGGPDYSFQMGLFSVTNAEFAAFLNDAMDHPSDARGAFLHFDTVSGDVHVHATALGARGEGSGGRTVLLFSPAVGGSIEWTGERYEIRAQPVDRAGHPVVGVSWFGAVKYCNWLTIDQGFGAGSRCYGEGADAELSRWRPVTIAPGQWASRDLTDAERQALVDGCRGFRLPMDDGYGNADPTRDAADAFNEFFKAAAWNATLSRNTTYGFGRDALLPSDANFRCSGDPFESPSNCQQGGTTPVGFFDGSVRDVDGIAFATAANDNSFGLFDLTGNVNQWMQDRYAPSATLDRRVVRGGSWSDAANGDALRLNRRILWASPGAVSDKIGFRVARGVPRATGDADGDGEITTLDVTHARVCHFGPGLPTLGGCAALDFDADGDVDLLDWAAFVAAFEAAGP